MAASLGVSLVSVYSFSQEALLGRLCSVRIADLDLRRRIYLVYTSRAPLSPAAQGFRAFVLERRARIAPAAGPDRRPCHVLRAWRPCRIRI